MMNLTMGHALHRSIPVEEINGYNWMVGLTTINLSRTSTTHIWWLPCPVFYTPSRSDLIYAGDTPEDRHDAQPPPQATR